MNLDRRLWEVRLDFDTISPTPVENVGALTAALLTQPGVSGAWGSLTDRGTAVSSGATVVIDAASPGDAVRDAIGVFTAAAISIGISPSRFREAVVQDAAADPRD